MQIQENKGIEVPTPPSRWALLWGFLYVKSRSYEVIYGNQSFQPPVHGPLYCPITLTGTPSVCISSSSHLRNSSTRVESLPHNTHSTYINLTLYNAFTTQDPCPVSPGRLRESMLSMPLRITPNSPLAYNQTFYKDKPTSHCAYVFPSQYSQQWQDH